MVLTTKAGGKEVVLEADLKDIDILQEDGEKYYTWEDFRRCPINDGEWHLNAGLVEKNNIAFTVCEKSLPLDFTARAWVDDESVREQRRARKAVGAPVEAKVTYKQHDDDLQAVFRWSQDG